jgi:pimeloyl-ACP methyl ester carboxylesterase
MNHARRRAATALALATAGSSGCLAPPAATAPMRVLRDAPTGPTQTLVVLLPGAYSRPEEFVREGFVSALRERGLAVEVVIADAHLGYFNERSVLVRLRDDVVQPARERGLRVWLVGISLGGFAALGYAARHGREIEGVLALAPYLGRRELQRDLVATGGPLGWRVQARPREPDDLEHDLWMWLSDPARRAGAAPTVHLGYGRDDRFADAHRLLEPLLPAGASDAVPGGHDWPAWRALWMRWLGRGLLPRGAVAGGASS